MLEIKIEHFANDRKTSYQTISNDLSNDFKRFSTIRKSPIVQDLGIIFSKIIDFNSVDWYN